MSMEEEDNIRQEYSKFCIEAGQKIGWVILIVATAIIFCHRYQKRWSVHVPGDFMMTNIRTFALKTQTHTHTHTDSTQGGV